MQLSRAEYAGKIKLVDIGTSSLEEVKLKADGFLITPSMVKEMLPQRHWDTHKILPESWG